LKSGAAGKWVMHPDDGLSDVDLDNDWYPFDKAGD